MNSVSPEDLFSEVNSSGPLKRVVNSRDRSASVAGRAARTAGSRRFAHRVRESGEGACPAVGRRILTTLFRQREPCPRTRFGEPFLVLRARVPGPRRGRTLTPSRETSVRPRPRRRRGDSALRAHACLRAAPAPSGRGGRGLRAGRNGAGGAEGPFPAPGGRPRARRGLSWAGGGHQARRARPMIVGRTRNHALGIDPWSSSSTSRGEFRSVLSVLRLGRQPAHASR